MLTLQTFDKSLLIEPMPTCMQSYWQELKTCFACIFLLHGKVQLSGIWLLDACVSNTSTMAMLLAHASFLQLLGSFLGNSPLPPQHDSLCTAHKLNQGIAFQESNSIPTAVTKQCAVFRWCI